jgi:neutral ceramidase
MPRLSHLSVLLLGLTILLSSPPTRAADAPAASWQAGVSSTKISPAEPIWMAGYGARTKPAEGTLSDLWAKALVLQDPAGKRVLLITLDVCGMDRETSDHIRDGVKQKLGLERDTVAICASHTHSGPVIGHKSTPHGWKTP